MDRYIYIELVVRGDIYDNILALIVRVYFESVQLGCIQKLKPDKMEDCAKQTTLSRKWGIKNSEKYNNDDNCASTVDYKTSSLLMEHRMVEIIA